MARTRAKDYDEKRAVVLRGAAKLFARDGYDRSSMANVASEIGVSKALLYHYYESKEALLFDILETHLQGLLDAVQGTNDEATVEPEERLTNLIGALLEAYRDADAEHKIQVDALKTLPLEQQRVITGVEREIVRIFSDAVLAVHPNLDGNPHVLKPATMSLFGMLNWLYMWFREDGPITRKDYAKIVSQIFIGGVKTL